MPSADASVRSSDLLPPRSLSFKLALLMLALLALLGAAGYFGAQFLLGEALNRDIQRFEAEGGRRLAAELNGLTLRIEGTAELLSRLAVNTPGGGGALRPSPPALLEGQNLAQVSSVGFWPEPNSLDVARDRASAYWVLGSSGKLEARDGYNDPRAVPYYREPWYTPARYAPAGRCWWTPAYYEPLVKREVVSCAMAMRSGPRFLGVVTLSISTSQLNKLLDEAAAGDPGYSLLVDTQGQILGVSSSARPVIERGGKPRNFAELAQRLTAFNPLAVVLHQRGEQARQTLAGQPGVSGKDISDLKTATRDFAAADAERVLTQLRAEQGAQTAGATPERVALGGDAVLDGPANGLISQLPGSAWVLIRVIPADQGLAAARQLFTQTLMLAGGLAGVLVLLLMILLSLMVFVPLRRIINKMASAPNTEMALNQVLEQTPRNELGALAFWINERGRQAREMLDRVGAGELRLSLEAKDRRGELDQLLRFHERTAPALQAVADAVITTNEQGFIEDMNPAAEQLTAVSLAAARGRPVADLINARSTTSDVTAATALLTAMQRGARLDPREDFELRGSGGSTRKVRIALLPVLARGNRVTGAVLVLHEAATAADAVASERRQTAEFKSSLPRRVACEKRLKELIDASRGKPLRHAVLAVDLDQLRRINETAGRSAGDDAIRKLGSVLVEKTGSLGEVFYLHADRYALLLSTFDANRARTLAEALRGSIAHLRVSGGPRPVGLTVSIGIAEFGAEAKPAEVLAHADDACATAKRSGRNAVKVYDQGMARTERDVDDITWVRRIRAGLDQHMLHLTTQSVASPQQPTGDGTMFESLLMLEDEEGFWSAATAFMPAAERHGLAAAVDRWHIGSIAAKLVRDGETLRHVSMVSIRISQSSIFDPELPDFLIELMEKHKALAGRICLELTETSILAYPQQTYSLAEVMRIVGVRFAISDFLGREPASLAQLRQLPVDYVRMDARRFRSIGSDPLEQKLADSVLQLARSLKKQTWVFGIDDAAQLEAWRRLNADHYQGNAVAKPSPAPFQLPH